MEKTIGLIIKTLILGVILTALIYFVNQDLYQSLIREDGVIEYLSAIMLLTSSVFIFVKILKVRSSRGPLWLIFHIFLSLILFFGFGEEISWGQRLFSITSPDFFLEHNLQNETNLHNLKINDVKINKVIFTYGLSVVFGIYFFLLPPGYKRIERLKKIVDKFGVPVPKIGHTIAFLVLSTIIFIVPDGKKWELWECLFALFFFLILLEPYNYDERLFPGIRTTSIN